MYTVVFENFQGKGMRKWVLWGHHFGEYQDMFDLPKISEHQKIIEFACGPTSVNQELSQKSNQVVSVDPWFELDLQKMRKRFVENFDFQIDNIKTHPERFDLKKYGGIDQLIEQRQKGMRTFFDDFEAGWQQGRYQHIQMDKVLPFDNACFDYALCANYLFTDLIHQDIEFHVHWIKEMARVARDVRIYPLTNYKAKPSEILGPVLLALQHQGYQVSIQEVPFRFVPESKAMLKVQAGLCELR